MIAALDCYPNARAHFDAFPPGSKKIILEWIKMAMQPATRAKRI
ncbi:MAG: YdeI/OmpD-associated family protein [Pseudomonadota bacterium]